MGEIFANVLQVSIGMSLVIGILLIFLPRLRKRYEVKWCYYIWLMIAIRLLIPINLQWTQGENLHQSIQADRLGNGLDDVQSQIEQSNNRSKLVEKGEQQEEAKTKSLATVQETKVENGLTSQGANQENTQENTQENNYKASSLSVNSNLLRVGILQQLQNWIQILLQGKRLQYLSGLWILGVIVFAGYYIISYWQFKRACKRWGVRRFNEEEQTILEGLKMELNIKESIEVIKSKKVSTPLIVGYLKPMIILPHHTYNPEHLYFILKHEFMHYKRKDLWYKLLMLVVYILHWFNPLVYLMARQMDQDLEVACDCSVMHNEDIQRKKIYMQTILKIAEVKHGSYVKFSTQLQSDKKMLRHRFEEIIGKETKHKGIMAFILLMIVSIGCSGCFTIETQGNNEEDKQPIEATVETSSSIQEVTNDVPETYEGQIVSIEDYRVTIPEDWEVKVVENPEEGDYPSGQAVSFFKEGEKIGGASLTIEYGDMWTVRPGEFSNLNDLEEEMSKGLYPMEINYSKEGRAYYSEYIWTEMSKKNEAYIFRVYLDCRKVSEKEVQSIVESFKMAIVTEGAPNKVRKPLSLEEVSKQAVYKISSVTGVEMAYNEQFLEKFQQSIERGQKDKLEVIAYTKDKNGLEIKSWDTLVTVEGKAYAYSYEALKDGNYRYVGAPIEFDFIDKCEYETVTRYGLGKNGESNSTRLIEVAKGYILKKNFLNKTEQTIYNQYQETKEEALLKDVSPISIAKLYVQADLDSDYETQYALMVEYEPESKMMGWSKEEHLKNAKEHSAEESKTQLLKRMGDIGIGEFIQQSEQEGYIKYECYDEQVSKYQEMGFQLEKNEEGIWKVCFMPIQ